MSAKILREVFQAHQQAWGKEDDGYLFDNGPEPLSRIDVLVYRPDADIDMTSFATVGMAVATMPTGNSRAELLFACRGPLSAASENAVAQQLANIATYPWAASTAVAWGQTLSLGKDFPGFPGCQAVFLSGPLTNEARDYIQTSAGAIRIINVIPITEAERAQAASVSPITFIQSLMEQVDIFSPRS